MSKKKGLISSQQYNEEAYNLRNMLTKFQIQELHVAALLAGRCLEHIIASSDCQLRHTLIYPVPHTTTKLRNANCLTYQWQHVPSACRKS